MRATGLQETPATAPIDVGHEVVLVVEDDALKRRSRLKTCLRRDMPRMPSFIMDGSTPVCCYWPNPIASRSWPDDPDGARQWTRR
jgi:hypothetical protein